MHLREILRFKRTSGGGVPMEVLLKLGLPMPDDVLEQFVGDHGTKEEFQEQYDALDVHAMRWQLLDLPASEILTCSVYPGFQDRIEAVANWMRAVPKKGWRDGYMTRAALLHWQQQGTWMRPPVTIRGALLDCSSPLHLVEGHTRIGALMGLVDSGMLPPSSRHRTWVGEDFAPENDDERWRDVLQSERIPFLDWLMDHVGDEGQIGKIASRLINVQHGSLQKVRVEGNDLDAVLAFARADTLLSPMLETILQAHKKWLQFVSA